VTGRARRQGKYLAPGGGPPQARLNRYRGRYAEAESRYGPRPNLAEATAAYAALAADAGLAPAELALRCAARRLPVAFSSGKVLGCQRAGGKLAGVKTLLQRAWLAPHGRTTHSCCGAWCLILGPLGRACSGLARTPHLTTSAAPRCSVQHMRAPSAPGCSAPGAQGGPSSAGARARRFVLSQPLVAGAVVGATGEAQLRELADAAARGALPSDLLQAVDRIHWRYPNPAP
jgi:hypothetical protein